MRTFYLTVGVKYAYEEHPQGLVPDRWVAIDAQSMIEARALAFDLYGSHWAFLYGEDSFRFDLHPGGMQFHVCVNRKPVPL